MRKKGLSIFPRLFLAFLAVVLLISVVLTTIFVVYSRRSLELQTRESILRQLDTIGYHFQGEVRDRLLKDLQSLSSDPDVDAFLRSRRDQRADRRRAAERVLIETLRHSRDYSGIYLVDEGGRELIRENRTGRPVTARPAEKGPLVAKIATAQPGSIDIEGPRAESNGAVLFSAAVYKKAGGAGGPGAALIIDYDMNDYLDHVGGLEIFGEHPFWVLRADGDVLKRPGGSGLFDPRPYLTKEFQAAPTLVMADGGMLVYQDLYVNPGRPLVRLAVGIPSSLLFRDIQPLFRFFILVFALSLLVITVIAYSFAGYLSRPIIDLARAASRVAAGDLSARVAEQSTGEVRLLIDGFNRMAADLETTTVSKEYLDNILDSMMDTLIVVSPEGEIVRMNAAACFLLGYEERELAGRPITTVLADGSETMTPLTADIVEKGSISVEEKIYLAKNGRRVPVLFSASIMRDPLNTVIGLIFVAQDITERKRTEARLQSSSEELQEINEELKNFAYIVSHDLRAPLVNIKGFSEELRMGIREIGPIVEKNLAGLPKGERARIGDVLNKDIPEALGFIGSSVLRMDNLIQSVLKLSRAGRRKLVPEPVSVPAMINDILKSLAHQLEDRNVRVQIGEMPAVVADRAALEQIFGNLLDNAVKYLDPERPGRIDISADLGKEEVLLHISDNGRGIAKEDIPKVFDVFRRVGRQDVPGEGMGLAYVKALVRLHGGRIWCESSPGAGSTFSFSLPVPRNEP